MNVYIYDDFLNKNRHQRALNKIEIRLTDLGLNGKIIRLGAIKNIKLLIQQELRNGAKNIVAVGNNATINKVASALVSDSLYDSFSQDVLLSIIPVGDNQSIAKSLGIKKEEEACNTILARRIETIDVGVAGSHFFLNKAELSGNDIQVEFPQDYSLETLNKSSFIIYNLNDNPDLKNEVRLSPNDGKLGLLINGRSKDQSYFSVEEVKITSKNLLLLDEVIEIQTPTKVSVLNKKIKIIVGRDRLFN